MKRLSTLPRPGRKRPGSRMSKEEGWAVIRALSEGCAVQDVAAALDTTSPALFSRMGSWAMTYLKAEK